ncbi:MAG: hypothetical protein H8E57_06410 [Candidatus Cloacimonetes bacterium]|nr:hypothetical protein [Candidatus Cloacimonadota bacterium]
MKRTPRTVPVAEQDTVNGSTVIIEEDKGISETLIWVRVEKTNYYRQQIYEETY